jgi:hypothetical protein
MSTYNMEGSNTRYMIDRLINFGIDSGEAIQILRYTVDDVVTQVRC